MSIINNIRNYYEQLVAEEILRRLPEQDNSDHLADIACVSLNRLPPKYISHEVDMAFYMSPNELLATRERVATAVAEAIIFVDEHRRDNRQ